MTGMATKTKDKTPERKAPSPKFVLRVKRAKRGQDGEKEPVLKREGLARVPEVKERKEGKNPGKQRGEEKEKTGTLMEREEGIGEGKEEEGREDDSPHERGETGASCASRTLTAQSDMTPEQTPPGDAITLSLSGKRALPVFYGEDVDVDRELSKMRLTPGVHCSVCEIGEECPEYEEGSVCAYNKQFSAFPVRNALSVMRLMSHIVEQNKTRLLRSYHSEEAVNGGMIRGDVTSLSDVVLRQLHGLLELHQSSMEATVTIDNVSPDRTPGILSQLFSKAQSSVSEGEERKAVSATGVEVTSQSAVPALTADGHPGGLSEPHAGEAPGPSHTQHAAAPADIRLNNTSLSSHTQELLGDDELRQELAERLGTEQSAIDTEGEVLKDDEELDDDDDD